MTTRTRHLFSLPGRDALARTLRLHPLLAFDFDGTLAPIVAHPNDARLSAVVSECLASLAMRLPVAIVTGRSVDDVRGRLGFAPRFIVGNHGAEDAGAAAAPSAALASLRLHLRQLVPTLATAGVTVEDKGYSLALHYRQAPTREGALRCINALLAEHPAGVRVFGGKMVVNVVPLCAPDKSDAVRALVDRSGTTCAIFAGDDVNDEPVFATAPAEWLTIRVGQDGARTRAKFVLDSPEEVATLLARMAALLAP